MTRPRADTYADYFQQYVDQVPDGDLNATSAACFAESIGMLEGLSDDQWMHRYQPGKWSVKELVGHIVDTERIMTTRALVFARGESQDYPGFEQDDFVAAADFDGRSPKNILDEWKGLRASTAALYESLSDAELDRSGTADGKACTARALFWIVAGHERHHMKVLRERYL